jgi:hypothetical protein
MGSVSAILKDLYTIELKMLWSELRRFMVKNVVIVMLLLVSSGLFFLLKVTFNELQIHQYALKSVLSKEKRRCATSP